MDTRNRWLALIALGLFTLAVPASLLAADPADADERESETKVIVVHDGDEEIVIEMGDIHEIVAEAMEGLDEVMAELQDMQLEVRLGQDNQLDLSYDDTTFELDLDQIMTQVAAAVQLGLAEFETGEWTHSRDRWADVSEDCLLYTSDAADDVSTV